VVRFAHSARKMAELDQSQSVELFVDWSLKLPARWLCQKCLEKFALVQVGFGVQRAAEAAAHAARRYIHGLQRGESVLKMDFSDAFNSVHRDSIFEAACDKLLELFTFIFICYSNSSFL
jgi:hypothetical protein